MFKPWIDPDIGEKAKYLHDKLISEKVTQSGKFREDAIKDYCRQYDWFLPAIQDLLNSIYTEELASNTEKVEDAIEAISGEKIDTEKAIAKEKANEMASIDASTLFSDEETTEESPKRKKGNAVDIIEA